MAIRLRWRREGCGSETRRGVVAFSRIAHDALHPASCTRRDVFWGMQSHHRLSVFLLPQLQPARCGHVVPIRGPKLQFLHGISRTVGSLKSTPPLR